MATQSLAQPSWNEELWHTIFAQGHPLLIEKQQRFRAQGSPPRCKLCLAPLNVTREVGQTQEEQPGPSNRNPRYCSLCDVFIRENPGGAKVTLSMVFADVRDSTRLSEELDLSDYVRLMNDFYAVTTGIFVDTDGFMMDVIGDEVFALYPTGFSGVSSAEETSDQRLRNAAQKALLAAERLVQVSGRNVPEAFAFGTSVHTAEVYIGTIRGAEDGIFDVRVWGPEVIKAARLASAARGGEALVTESACQTARFDLALLEPAALDLKGFTEPARVRRLGNHG